MKRVLALLVSLISLPTAAATLLRAAREDQERQEQWSRRQLAPVDHEEVVQGFGRALEHLLMDGLNSFDPFPLDKTHRFDFHNFPMSKYCGGMPDAVMDAHIDVHIPYLEGLSTFYEYSWVVEQGRKKPRDFPTCPWSGTFNMTGEFLHLYSTMDMTVNTISTNCGKRWDLSTKIEGIEVYLSTGPIVDFSVFLNGTYSFESNTATAAEAILQTMTFTYSDVQVKWPNNMIVAPWIKKLMERQMIQFAEKEVDAYVTPTVQSALNAHLADDFPMELDITGKIVG